MTTPNQDALNLLKRSKHIACLSQSPANGDGVCALLALQNLWSENEKNVSVIVPKALSKRYENLPGIQKINNHFEGQGDFIISLLTENAQVDRIKYQVESDRVNIVVTPKKSGFSASDILSRQESSPLDLIVVCDSPSLESLGEIFSQDPSRFRNTPILNLSHLPGSQDFGTVNLIKPQFGSSCEVLLELIESDETLKKRLTPDLSSLLLAGILLKTHNFQSPQTSPYSFGAASRLQALGANQSDIIEQFFKQKSFRTLKLWGEVFSLLQFDPVHHIAWSTLSQGHFQEYSGNSEDIETLNQDLLRFTNTADFSVLFLEDEVIQVQISSQRSDLDWREFEKHFPDSHHTEKGLLLEFDDRSFSQVQNEVLDYLLQYQKRSYHLDPQTPLQKTKLSASRKEDKILPKITPKPPASPQDLPFIAPFSTPKTKPAKKTRSAIPDWLKKNFPEN